MAEDAKQIELSKPRRLLSMRTEQWERRDNYAWVRDASRSSVGTLDLAYFFAHTCLERHLAFPEQSMCDPAGALIIVGSFRVCQCGEVVLETSLKCEAGQMSAGRALRRLEAVTLRALSTRSEAGVKNSSAEEPITSGSSRRQAPV